MFESKDRAELAKCGIVSLLDLALLVPKSFDDLSIKDEPNEGENVVEIECRFHHRKGSILFITAFNYCKYYSLFYLCDLNLL